MSVNEYYGLTPMTFRQELDAPDPVRETRGLKVEIIRNCDSIIAIAERVRNYAKRIPEENDAGHAELVNEYAQGIHSVLLALLENERRKYGSVNS